MADINSTVVRLPGKRRFQPPAIKSQPTQKRLTQQRCAAIAVASVAVALLGLSLAHLAAGVELLTNAPKWEAWALAIGLDIGFISAEAALLCAATPSVHREVAKFATPIIVGTIMASAGMNALAFAYQSSGWMVYPAAALGTVIPGMVYALSRVAFALSASR
jgi:hypothetical protein